MTFSCNQCGACCKVLPKLVAPWLVGDNGFCRHLKDNKCEIYENRPDICNHDTMFASVDISKEEYDKMSMSICKKLEEIANELD